ncbi:50S ribosomal protein P1 [Candidatus Micrarchaeota archaeon]|nr:50S ribosomal protein P1 [Candidatus Micrarchaeota archaeon]
MEYVYAALLLHSTKQPINEDNVKKTLSAIGAQPDEAKVKSLVASLDGVNIEEAIKQAAVVAAPAAGTAEGKKADKKEEEKEEKKEEEAAAGLASLFG